VAPVIKQIRLFIRWLHFYRYATPAEKGLT